MNFRKERLLYHLLIIIIAIGAFTGASYAQSVTIGGATPSGTPLPNPTVTPAPSGSFDVVATPSATPTSVVFYRNDIAIATDTTSPYKINQNQLPQDTYTYHARAYFSGGAVAESGDFRISVTTKQIIKMGASTYGQPTTTGPDDEYDHTTEVRNAVNYLGSNGGGTLFFPCLLPIGEDYAIYNIQDTIDIPSNVTLQGEGAETQGRCRIYWYDPEGDYGEEECNSVENTPEYLHNKPMFRVNGGYGRVRFRDLAIYNRASGPDCEVRSDFENIEAEQTAAIELNTGDPSCGGIFSCPFDPGGDITDIVFENVSINYFTWGIKAVSDIVSTEHEISDVKIRGYRPSANFRQLYIDAINAHDWDVQNLNLSYMLEDQGAVEIINAGGGGDGLKFLQLSCDGNFDRTPAFCVRVEKHGGLYFRQLHHEGTDQAIIVEDISGRSELNTNSDPIVMETSIASGIFKDASMTLYLIGNAIITAPETNTNPLQDDGRMRFEGDGLDSTVYDCGDMHYDITPVPNPSPSPSEPKMLFTYSERNRTSFLAEEDGSKYPMVHTVCPSGINAVGGKYFNSGVLPNEPGLYSNVFSASCPLGACNVRNTLHTLFTAGGSVYIDGEYTVNGTVTVPRGAQIIGAPGSKLTESQGVPLFQIDVPINTTDQFGASGIVIRNLELATTSGSATGILILGEDSTSTGVSRDIYFSGLKFNGLNKGFEARSYGSGKGEPMINGMGLKDLTFVNNAIAVNTTSQNASNWNVMNLSIASNTESAEGWYQTYGGHQGMQDVRCVGTTYDMVDCIRLQMSAGFFLNDLRKTVNVTNSLNVGVGASPWNEAPYIAPQLTAMTLRNNDFTSPVTNKGQVKLDGKAVITSMNNQYQYFSVSGSNQANISRLTYCGDTYPGTPYSTSLADDFLNYWVGHNTPTRIHCGSRPVPWDDAVRWTYDRTDDDNLGTPLVGNFFDNTKEDFVVYVEGSTSRFIAQQPDGPERWNIEWGSGNEKDIPLIGNFYPSSSRAQILVYRPKTLTSSEWRILDPSTCTFTTTPTPSSACSTDTSWVWGNDTYDDIPFIGNFFDESGGGYTGNMDEIGIYRPGTNDFWIKNPRTGAYIVLNPANSSGDQIQVGDFLGKGYDQVAQYDSSNGNFYITDPRSPYGEYTSNVTGVTETSDDIPVPGKYQATLSGKDPCIQVGIWRPSNQTFYIAEVNPTPYGGASARNCGTRNANMVWGSNDDYGSQSPVPDIPLTISGAGGLRRPTTYRPTKGAFPHSIGDGQWWVHDLF